MVVGRGIGITQSVYLGKEKMKIKLDAVFINDRKQDGSAYPNGGRRVSIKWDGDKSASQFLSPKFGDKPNPKFEEHLALFNDWKEGDTVDVVLEQNGEYTNFKLPRPIDLLEARVEKLEKIIKVLWKERE